MNPLSSLIGVKSAEEIRAEKNAEYDRQQQLHQRRLAAPARKAKRRTAAESRRANRAAR